MQLPVGVNDAELEERIIQHLAAAAAMGRRHIARREGQRTRSSAQGRPQFLVFQSPNVPAGQISSSPAQRVEGESVATISVPTLSSPSTHVLEGSLQPIIPQSSDVQADGASASASGSSILASNQHENSLNNRYYYSFNVFSLSTLSLVPISPKFLYALLLTVYFV